MIKNNKKVYGNLLCNSLRKNRKGQVTIFIIVAILIVGGIVTYLILRDNLSVTNVPVSVQPVYNTFLSCVEEQALVGISLLESQAGYIVLPDFVPGSTYMPFSSQLNFLGNPIPYWYYVSGNNIQDEQIPTEQEMEESLGDFIDSRISICNFESYYEEGFEISLGESKTTVDIKDGAVTMSMNLDLSISKGNDSVVVSNHNIEVKSNLFSLYNSALTIYEKEQSELFLENYGLDILRLYAPVDGVEITCSPLVWSAEEIFSDLKEAIETNTLALSTEEPTTSDEKYFYIDANIDDGVRFINSRDWVYSFEVLPSEGNSLISEPVGNQEGLGTLGFCYVPYHFVYDLKYPILVQIYDGDETFQFPLAIVIDGNQARNSLDTTALEIDNEFCNDMNSLTSVNIYDSDLNPVEAKISYECFGTTCDIGETAAGVLQSEFPQCVNGFIIVSADGFQEKKYQYSSVDEGSISLILNKLYELEIDLNLGGSAYIQDALIYFVSDDDSIVVNYPDKTKVNLSDGDYTVSVYAYRNSSIQFQETTTEECIEVSSSGLGGFLGFTEEKCFEVTVPAQVITNVLAGGGQENYSFSDGVLKSSGTIQINADTFSVPTTIEGVQNNYLLFEESGLEINLT
ncbi:hypothetical protein M0R72_09660 [Candidatus Pacearchaeota archaeon]|jgi:hypothetical protein|nr:hypothetical protein [Candidatus Pacearchaeota archaeon]